VSRDVHSLHVHAPTAAARTEAWQAVRAAVQRAGYREVARGGDVTVRGGGRAPWLSILADDPAVLDPLAASIARATRRPVLQATCEASAIVVLTLRAGAKRYAWPDGPTPSSRVLSPLLARGDARTFEAAFARGLADAFPEAALAAAARELGIDPATMLGERAPRGEILRLAKPATVASPARAHTARLEVGWRSNRSWGDRHLVFVGQKSTLTVDVSGQGALLEADVTAEPPFVEVRDVRPNAATATIDVAIRPIRAGACTLRVTARTRRARVADDLAVQVEPLPYRPRAARSADIATLFQMHRREWVYAFASFSVDLGTAWAWAEPHARAWAELNADHSTPMVRVEDAREPLRSVLPSGRTVVVEAASYRFGTFEPLGDPGEPLAIELVLRARAREDASPQLSRLAAVCDRVMRDGVGWSAIAGEQGDRPEELTGWERATLGVRDPARTARWHATHLRGLDAMFWIGDALAARVDLSALGRLARVDRVGAGYRVTMPPDAPRAGFAPIETLLADVLPGG
jgi:hypothetical protein